MHDLRHAFRQLAKSPGFTAVAVLLLALGVGANTALFSVFKAQVLAPFPYPEAERIVQLWRTNSTRFETNPWSRADFFDVQAQSTAFAEIGLYVQNRFNLGSETPQSLQGINCMPGVLRALGMQPALGRLFTDDDDRTDAPPVVVLSHAAWLKHCAGDPGIVGREIRLNAQPCTVVGVMPASFEFYCPWTALRAIDLWVPLRATRDPGNRGSHGSLAVARLKPGVSLDAANAELKVIADRLALAYPETNYGKWFYGRILPAEIGSRAVIQHGPVFTAVVLVLLVACANVAIMLLARGAGRQVEYAVRLALGATRGQLIRLALAESFVLALLGSVAGVLLAWNLTGLLGALFPPVTVYATTIRIDPTVLWFSLALAQFAALAAGIPPALTASRTQVSDTIKQGGPTQAGGRTRHRFLHHLVATQIAIALLLVNGALLLFASFRSAVAANAPLASEFVLTGGVALNRTRYPAARERVAAWEQILARVRALPGVTAAGVTSKLPLRGGNNLTILADGEEFDPKRQRPTVENSIVSPGYFDAMGIRLLQGRNLELPADTARDNLKVVVNRTLAVRYWPGRDPIGQRIRANGPRPFFTATVVGVVEDARQWQVNRPALPEVYFGSGFDTRSLEFLVVRSALDAHRLEPLLRRELAMFDPDLALIDPQTMAEVVSDAGRAYKNLLVLVHFFMGVTLVMAAVGISGTLAFQTRQRTREIGLRIALGADARRVAWLVLRQTTSWIVAGGVVGLVLSFGAAALLRAVFADIGLLDPRYLAGGLLILVGVIALASWLPARGATRVNPVEALRAE